MRRGAPIPPIPKLVLSVHGSRPETGIAALAAGSQSCPAAGPVRNVARMVIVARNRTVNQIPRIRENPVKQTALHFYGRSRRQCVYARFIAILKLPFKFDRS